MKKLISIYIFFKIIWIIGLVWFIFQIPTMKSLENISKDNKIDAIVALTGGIYRVEEGINLFLNDASKILFISGVESPAYVKELLKINHNNPRVILGTEAKSTYDNAKDIESWVEKYKLKSIKLVTANYHMPRASMVIKTLNPDLQIIQHPVFPEAFNLRKWRKSSITLKLLLTEYNKYILLKIFLMLGIKIEQHRMLQL